MLTLSTFDADAVLIVFALRDAVPQRNPAFHRFLKTSAQRSVDDLDQRNHGVVIGSVGVVEISFIHQNRSSRVEFW